MVLGNAASRIFSSRRSFALEAKYIDNGIGALSEGMPLISSGRSALKSEEVCYNMLAKSKEELYAKSPYNVVRLILGKEFQDDNKDNNRYTRTAKDFKKWSE